MNIWQMLKSTCQRTTEKTEGQTLTHLKHKTEYTTMMREKLAGSTLATWPSRYAETQRGGVSTGFLYSRSRLCFPAPVALRSLSLASQSLYLNIYSTFFRAIYPLNFFVKRSIAAAPCRGHCRLFAIPHCGTAK